MQKAVGPILWICFAALTVCGCFTQQRTQQQSFEDEVRIACGDPEHMVYPLSEQCTSLFGNKGWILRHKSDLVVAARQACNPSDDDLQACGPTLKATRACASVSADPDKFVPANYSTCVAALEKNPACDRTEAFVKYMHTRQPSDYSPECVAAVARVTNFDDEVTKAQLQAQFTPPSTSRPTIIRSYPGYTHCTALGDTSSCYSY
jgi:hypothetical protein